MRLDLDDKTGKLTVASADRAARMLRAAATVERLLVASGEIEADESVAEALNCHAERLVVDEPSVKD